MDADNLIPVLKVGAYFATLIGAAGLVTTKIATSKKRVPYNARATYAALGATALVFTWMNIIGFMADDMNEYQNVAQWLKESEFFAKAYVMVSDRAAGWWWSSQLLLWVLPFVVFVSAEASKDTGSTITGGDLSIPATVALLWIAFGGAISVAFPMFLCLVDHGKRRIAKLRDADVVERPSASGGSASLTARVGEWILLGVVVGGIASISAFPYLKGIEFNRNLLFLHALLLVPAAVRVPRDSRLKLPLAIIAIAALVHQGHQFRIALQESNDLAALLAGGFANKCQAGISLDIVFGTLETAAFVYFDTGRWLPAVVVAVVSPFTSLASVFAIILVSRYGRV